MIPVYDEIQEEKSLSESPPADSQSVTTEETPVRSEENREEPVTQP